MRGLARVAAETGGHNEFAFRKIDLAGERDVAVGSDVVLFRQPLVDAEIGLAVGNARIADGPRPPRRRTGQCQGDIVALGRKDRHALVLVQLGRVAAAAVAEMRAQKDMDSIVREIACQRTKAYMLEQRVPLRVGNDQLFDHVASVAARVHHAKAGHAGGDPFDMRRCVVLLLRKEIVGRNNQADILDGCPIDVCG